MRQLTFTAHLFRNFVFPYVGASSVKDVSEWDTQLRLIKKLKDPALTVQVELTDAEREAEAQGQVVYRFYQLREEKGTFQLEEDERDLLKRRIEDNRTRVNAIAAEDFDELRAGEAGRSRADARHHRPGSGAVTTWR